MPYWWPGEGEAEVSLDLWMLELGCFHAFLAELERKRVMSKATFGLCQVLVQIPRISRSAVQYGAAASL
jgi:hypothetical protein